MMVGGRLLNGQRGVAIITVMLMVTLATITVTTMVTRQRLDIYRAGNRQADLQAKKLALGGERFAIQQLHLDRRKAERSNSDSFEDRWFGSTLVPVEGGTISGCIVDLQGRFNLNSLVDDKGALNVDQRDQFQRLLVVLDIDSLKVAAIVDWLDADSNIIDADGAEDDYYSLRDPPYLAANQRFASVSELKLVKGFNELDDDENREHYELLLPHISALPEVTPININTATPAVIESLAEFVVASKAETLSQWSGASYLEYPECAEPAGQDQSGAEAVAGSDKEIYESTDSFVSEINSEQTGPDDPKFANIDLITIESRYFEVRVDVELGPINIPQFSLVRRDNDGIVTVLQRARGDNLLQIGGK